ncbi:beta-lactamase family protein [Terrimonas sp. NA20]|uniref:Beta-lactamase family protein n=1 Tax=Terrimonas ginsenosidimutans TaxID=2908004 RepID=A0ABS9KN24_9BACT|nr:serine hydrolase domain-containing protein [Terrimonas ginsenosidimutans]MCG2613720.1 beta-lactamase family protein [Terrimonas ginsenosidimutans]
MIRPFLICTLVMLFSASSLTAQTDKASINKISLELEKMAQHDHLSGVILVAKNNKILYQKAFGFANRADQVRNQLHTRFNMASMTKMFTGMAILQLAESGKLSIDHMVGRYLPDYPNKTIADSVTIHQLLTHTAGLGNFWEELDKVPKEKYLSVDDYLPLFASKPLAFKPGSRYAYSNAGYILLGKIIEQVSGQTYFDFVRDHILLPAGMLDTEAFELDNAQPRIATGYTMSPEKPGHWKNNNYVNVFKGGPAGGYYTTAEDLLRFSKAVLSNVLLNKHSTGLYLKGKVKYDRGYYAYGMSTDTLNGYGILGHTGGHFGIANEFFICPDLGYTVIIMTNGEVENYWDASNLIKSTLFGATTATDKYYFTKKVIREVSGNGEEAGYKLAVGKGPSDQLRESVIDRWAYHLLFDKKTQTAIALFRLNVKCFPGSSSALYSLAEGYRLTADKTNAIRIYEQYLLLEPDDAEAKEKLHSLMKSNN